MAEYIVDEEELLSVEPPIKPLDWEFPERVVRCKDCMHYENKNCKYWNGYAFDHLCWYFADSDGYPAEVDPNGFCAWGEPKEVS